MGTIVNLGWKGKVSAAASFSGGSWVSTAPLSNLEDPRPGIIARSTNANLTSTKFNLDLGASYAFQMMVVAASNLEAAALYKFTWWNAAFSSEAGNTGWTAIPGFPTHNHENRGVDICHIFDDVKTYRYVTLELDNTTNSEGRVDLGYFNLFEVWEPPVNFGAGSDDSLIPFTTTVEADGGTQYHRRRRARRSHRLTWAALDRSLVEDDLRELRNYQGVDREVFLVPNPDDTDQYNQRNFLGKLVDLPGIGYIPATLMSTGFSVMEVI